MRRLFVGLLLAMLVAAAMAWLIQLDAGYVLLQFHGYTIETSVWVGALLLVLGVGLIWALSQVLAGLFALLAAMLGLPARGPIARLRAFWSAQRNRSADRGVIEFYQGHWRRALRHLARTANRVDSPLVYQLLAARSAEELGDRELAEGFLQLAERNERAADVVAVARAEMVARFGNDAEALKQLDALAPDAAAHPSAVRLQVELMARTGDWSRVSARMPDMRRYQIMPAPALDTLEERACRELLAAATVDSSNPLDDLRKCWQSLNGRMRSRSAILVDYAHSLTRLGAGAEAEKLLADTLRSDLDDTLIHAWGAAPAESPEKQLALGEKLLERQPENPVLLLALGRIAARNRLWGKARDYLNASAARGCEAEAQNLLQALPG